MLFVPAHVRRFVESAPTRGADAYILDLEDSVPAGLKPLARETLQASARHIATETENTGTAVLVRINSSPAEAELDLAAAVNSSVGAIVLPKVESGESVRFLAGKIAKLEAQAGLPSGHTRLIAQIESVQAFSRMDEIAASSPALLGMTLGSEDFSASAGMQPLPETLYWPNQQLVFACRRAGILPFGFPGSIAAYDDLAGFRQVVRQAARMGFVGAFCVHPSQVPILNDEFAPSMPQIEEAREMIAVFEAAAREGRGAVQFKGKMVDPPVVEQARTLLLRARIA